jgi:hypothetical protein
MISIRDTRKDPSAQPDHPSMGSERSAWFKKILGHFSVRLPDQRTENKAQAQKDQLQSLVACGKEPVALERTCLRK